MSEENEQKQEKENFFREVREWFAEHWLSILSIIIFALVVGWQIYSGMYDLKAISTNQVLENREAWRGQRIVLSNVSISRYEIRETGENTYIMLQVVNGETNPPINQKTLPIIGIMPTKEARQVDSLPRLLKSGVTNLQEIRIMIRKDIISIDSYKVYLEFSFFNTPYWLTLRTVNRFASLLVSVWAGIIVQAIVYFIILILVILGLVFIVPSFE